MTELQTQKPPTEPLTEQQTPEMNRSVQAAAEIMDQFAGSIPELEANRESVESAAQELIEDFGIDDSFFDAPERSLVFLSIAAKLVAVKEKEREGGLQFAEREYIADTTLVLARKHVTGFDDIRQALEDEHNQSQLSEKARAEAYDKFTDIQFTERMTQAIDDGLLDDVKERLGITAENEDPYKLRVLSINENGSDVYNFKLPKFPTDEALEKMSPAEKKTAYDNWEIDIAAKKQWEEGLIERRQKFFNALGRDEIEALAWVTSIDGVQQLCITSTLAERFLDAEDVAADNYGEGERDRELALIEHEYTHTQGGLLVDGDNEFGLTVEELRAEYGGRNKQGYGDAKNFANDLGVITGVDLRSLIGEGQEKGGKQAELMTSLANAYGLESVVDILAVMPANYVKPQRSPVLRAIQSHVGGFDGVEKRLMDRQIQLDGGPDGIRQRTEERVEHYKGLTSDSVLGIDDFLGYRESMHGLVYMTNMYREIAKEKGYIK